MRLSHHDIVRPRGVTVATVSAAGSATSGLKVVRHGGSGDAWVSCATGGELGFGRLQSGWP
jgi:hypothetical protein